MTVTTQTQRPFNPLPVILIMALAALAVGTLLALQVRSRTHAVKKHGAEALAIRQSCEQKGPIDVWRSLSPGDEKFFQLCELQDGRIGLRILKCTAKGWMELTAFVAKGRLGNGTWARTEEYLLAKAEPFRGKLSRVCN